MRSGAQHHQVNRPTSSNFTRSSLNSNNSFVHKHNIGDKGQNQWTHNNGKWNQGNHNGNNWNHNGNNWNHNHNNWWGGGGWGFGWPWWGFIGFGSPFYGYNNYLYGYGNGFGYGNGYGYGYNNGYATAYAAALPEDTAVAAVDGQNDGQFAEQGEADFKAGNYKAAARDWQHALVDDPQNGAIMMLMAQALLAVGQYNEAAGATQAAMQMLPEDKWGVVVVNYAQLYGNPQDYTDQLKAVGKGARRESRESGIAIPAGLSFRVPGLSKKCRHGVGQGADRGAQGFGGLQDCGRYSRPSGPRRRRCRRRPSKPPRKPKGQQPPAGQGAPARLPPQRPTKGVETGSPS